jgi:hypothetical protein
MLSRNVRFLHPETNKIGFAFFLFFYIFYGFLKLQLNTLEYNYRQTLERSFRNYRYALLHGKHPGKT